MHKKVRCEYHLRIFLRFKFHEFHRALVNMTFGCYGFLNDNFQTPEMMFQIRLQY